MNLCLPIGSEFYYVHQHGQKDNTIISLLAVLREAEVEYETLKLNYDTIVSLVTTNRGVVTLRTNDFVVVSKEQKKAWVYTLREYAGMFYHRVEFLTRAKLANERLGWKRASRPEHISGGYIRPVYASMSEEARQFRKKERERLLNQGEGFKEKWRKRQQAFHEQEKARRKASGEQCPMMVGRRENAKPCKRKAGHDGRCKA